MIAAEFFKDGDGFDFTVRDSQFLFPGASTPEEKKAWFDGLHAAGYALKP